MFSFRFTSCIYWVAGAGPTRRVRTLAYCGGESLGQPASASLMAWALLWKPLNPRGRPGGCPRGRTRRASCARPFVQSQPPGPAVRYHAAFPQCGQGLADHPAPLYSALGGDLPPAVQAATQVCVMVLQVLCHEFQAVLASLHLLRLAGVDRGRQACHEQGAGSVLYTGTDGALRHSNTRWERVPGDMLSAPG